MSPRLPSARPRDMIRILEREGWIVVRQRGSHAQLRKEGNPRVISVAIHTKDMKRGTVQGILQDAEIGNERFVELIRS